MHTISPSVWVTVFCGVALLGVVTCRAQTAGEGEVRAISSRLELFVDEYLIESMNGVTRELHSPERKGPVMIFDRPWEGVLRHRLPRRRAIPDVLPGDAYERAIR